MQFSAVLNMFIVKTYLNSIFTNDLKRKDFFRKIFKVTEYAALKEYFQALEMDKMHIYVVFTY